MFMVIWMMVKIAILPKMVILTSMSYGENGQKHGQDSCLFKKHKKKSHFCKIIDSFDDFEA